MGSTARSPRVRARVTPHRGQGESLVPLYTRESVSLSLSVYAPCHGIISFYFRPTRVQNDDVR